MMRRCLRSFGLRLALSATALWPAVSAGVTGWEYQSLSNRHFVAAAAVGSGTFALLAGSDVVLYPSGDVVHPGAGQLHGISFSDSYAGTAVGENGTIIRSTDGGNTWMPQSSGVTSFLASVSFIDENYGIAVGELGTILQTSDGGSTWTPQDSQTNSFLTAVSMVSPLVAVAVGDSGTILRTDNGGATWISQDSGTDRWLAGVAMLGENTGLVTGVEGTILRTSDGGATWTSIPSGTTEWLWGVSLIGSTGIITSSRGTILRSTDGGLTWAPMTIAFFHLAAAVFTDEANGLVVGFHGTTRLTSDRGQTWAGGEDREDRLRMSVVAAPDSNSAVIVGPGGVVFRTSDGGDSWATVASGTTNNLNAVAFIDRANGLAVGGGGTILRTTDGGASWEIQLSGTKGNLSNVAYASSTVAYAPTGGPTFLRSDDGGVTWMQRSIPFDGVTDVSFTSPDVGIAAARGSEGCLNDVITTHDGGLHWNRTYSFACVGSTTRSDIVSIARNADRTWLAVVNRWIPHVPPPRWGEIWRWDDGGQIWLLQYSVFGVSGGYLTFVCDEIHGTVQLGLTTGSSSDGGRTWTFPSSFPAAPVCFANPNVGWALDGGLILHTTTGGM